MAEPQTPGEARRTGLRKARWVAAGAAVGAAAFLTGVIAGVNGADDADSVQQQISAANPGGVQQVPQRDADVDRYDDDVDRYDDDVDRYDDEFEDARPFDPQQQAPSFDPQSGSGAPSQQGPTFGPQTRSGGS